ncbi:MAG: hypothetical protein QW687_01015 [Candidatus Hadarchaeales archaeon]
MIPFPPIEQIKDENLVTVRRFEVSSPFAEGVTVLPETSMTVTPVDNSKFKVEITTESKLIFQVTLTLKFNKDTQVPIGPYQLISIVYREVDNNLMTPFGWKSANPTPVIEPEGNDCLSIKEVFLPDWERETVKIPTREEITEKLKTIGETVLTEWVSYLLNFRDITIPPTQLWVIYYEIFMLMNSFMEGKVRPSDLFKVELDFEVFPSDEREVVVSDIFTPPSPVMARRWTQRQWTEFINNTYTVRGVLDKDPKARTLIRRVREHFLTDPTAGQDIPLTPEPPTKELPTKKPSPTLPEGSNM